MASKKEMMGTAAQRLAAKHEPDPAPAPIQEPKPAKEEKKNDKPFTIWTTAENVRRWKSYQKLKSATVPTQAALVEAALNDYMKKHPVTDAEKTALLKSLGLDL